MSLKLEKNHDVVLISLQRKKYSVEDDLPISQHDAEKSAFGQNILEDWVRNRAKKDKSYRASALWTEGWFVSRWGDCHGR